MAEQDDTIERLIREAMPDEIVTHFVAIVEIAGEGSQELRFAMSKNMTPWLALGMLHGGIRMVDACDDPEDLHDLLNDFDEYDEDDE